MSYLSFNDPTDIAFPIIEINHITTTPKPMLVIIALGKLEGRAVGFRFFLQTHLKPVFALDPNDETGFSENYNIPWEEGGAFFNSVGEPTFDFCCLLADGIPPLDPPLSLHEAREQVIASALLLFGDLGLVQDFAVKGELSMDTIRPIKFTQPPILNLQQGNGADIVRVKVEVCDPEDTNNSATLFIQLDLNKKLLFFSEKDAWDRLNLLKAFAPIH